MADSIKFKRGNLASLPVLAVGEPAITTDDHYLYFGGGNGNIKVPKTAADVGLGNVTNESKATMFSSPALTGTPTAPTAASDVNTTQLATTAFVQALISANKYMKVLAPGATNTDFQAALVAADVIYLKPGVYGFSGTFTLNDSNRTPTILGYGASITNRIVFDGSSLSYNVGGATVHGVVFSEVELKNIAPFSWQTFYNCTFTVGLYLNGARHFAFQNCLFRPATGQCTLALNVNNNAFNGDLYFTNCEFVTNELIHPYIPNPADPYCEWRGMHFIDCIFYGGVASTNHCYIEGRGANIRLIDWYFTNCQFDQIASDYICTLQGQSVEPTKTRSVKGNFSFENCSGVLTSSGKTMFYATVCDGMRILNCSTNGDISMNGAADNCFIIGNACKAIILSGNNHIISLNYNTAATVSGTGVHTNNIVNPA